MADVINSTTLQLRKSVNTALPVYQAAPWVINPDMSQVDGVQRRYWKWDSGTNRPIPMTLAEQAAADAALLEAQRDSIAEQLDQQEDILRAVMTAVIAELNGHADKFNAILAAAAAANNLASFKAGMGAITDYPQRTIQQLRNVVRNALGS